MAGRGIAVRRPGCPITGVQESHGLAALLEQAGYRFEQKNGQRVFGPPYFWDGPPPERGCEVFVANLPRNAFEDELFPLFSRAGTIYQMRLMIDFSGTNRGFGFVQFTSPEEARSAITTVNQLEIRPGVCVRVFKSIDNRRLYVGNIAKEMSAAELTSFFRREVAGVVDVIVYHAINNKSLNRGFVFLEFASHTEAVCARRQLKLTFVQSGHPLVVDWAVPEPEVPDHIMKKVKVLYVRNLLLSTTEFIIWNAMTSVVGNAVVKVKKINDFAFVHFTTRCKAEMALMFWNNRDLDGSIVQVMWAKPIARAHFNTQATSINGLLQETTSNITGAPILSSVVKSCKPHSFPCKDTNTASQLYTWYDTENGNLFPTDYDYITPANTMENTSWPVDRAECVSLKYS